MRSVTDRNRAPHPQFRSWLTAVGMFDESVASLPTFQRVNERLVWSEQIEKSYDRNQPVSDVQL
jgi:hypothetical protein